MTDYKRARPLSEITAELSSGDPGDYSPEEIGTPQPDDVLDDGTAILPTSGVEVSACECDSLGVPQDGECVRGDEACNRIFTFFHPDGPVRLTETELCNQYMRLRSASGLWTAADPRIITLRRERDDATERISELRKFGQTYMEFFFKQRETSEGFVEVANAFVVGDLSMDEAFQAFLRHSASLNESGEPFSATTDNVSLSPDSDPTGAIELRKELGRVRAWGETNYARVDDLEAALEKIAALNEGWVAEDTKDYQAHLFHKAIDIARRVLAGGLPNSDGGDKVASDGGDS